MKTSRLRPISAKKVAAGQKYPALKRSRIKKRARPAKETNRIYGPKTRREWMKTLPCSACGVVGYSEGAHVLGNGGMSRKADADTQAPLCGLNYWPTTKVAYLYAGCHNLYDRHRDVFNARFPDFDAKRAAEETEQLRQEYQMRNQK